MRSRLTCLLFAGVFLAIPIANHLHAQTTTSGGLTGVITDQSSAVMPNATVEISDEARGTTRTTKTDREGVYRFFFLAPAKYLLTVTHDDFRKQSRAVNVQLGPPATLNLTLEIAKASSEITVRDDVPLIQAENGDVSATMNLKQISEVPNPGNDLTYIVQTAPGVVMNTDDAVNLGFNFSILGMPGNSYLYTMDGVNSNDNALNVGVIGALGLVIGQNQIQEATVVTTGYSGQFGGAAGGNITYLTKSGSNVLHGNAQYYWNGRILNANDWFNNAFGNPRPFDNANQWAGSLGGPIKKDKLFFFFDTEGVRLSIPQISLVQIPSLQFESATIANIDSVANNNSDPRHLTSATDVFYKQIFNLYNAAPGTRQVFYGLNVNDPTGCTGFVGPKTPSGQLGVDLPCTRYFLATRVPQNTDTLVSGRLDWNIGQNDHAFVRLQHDSGIGGLVSFINPMFDGQFEMSQWQAYVTETHTFGTSAASQFLVGISRFGRWWESKDFPKPAPVFPTLTFPTTNTFTNLGGWYGRYGHYTSQYQISEDVVITKGTQKFGFGGNLAPIHWKLPPNTKDPGQLALQTLDAFYQGGVDPASRATDFTMLTQSFTSQSSLPITFFNFGLYGEDEWHARPNFNVTFALRAEHYSNPVCETRCYARPAGPFEYISHDPQQAYNQAILINQRHAVEHMDAILWSPRFSFAWQPFGVSHSSVLRGGVGIFYDPLIGALLESFYLNSPNYNIYTPSGDNLTPNETTSLYKDAAASNAAFVKGFAAGENLAQIQRSDPNFSPPDLNASTRTLHAAQFQRWSLEFQQGLGANTSFSIGYFGHHGIHELWQNVSANAFGFGSFPSQPCASPPVLPCYDSRFSLVTEYRTEAVSNYNGMVASFQHQFTKWIRGMLQANYTYGHAFDEVSNGGIWPFTSAGLFNPQNPSNLRGAYGPAEYDVRHSFNASYVLELPVKAALHGHGSDYLVTGWQISGTIFARTGFPYTVIDAAESQLLAAKNNYFGTIYAVPVGPLPASTSCGEAAAFPSAPRPCVAPEVLVLPDGTMTANPGALFVQSGCETGFNTGNLGASGVCNGPRVTFAQGRNHFRGPNYFNTDFAITKNTKIHGWETAMLGIGFQFFNLFNHPNFGLPDSWISDPNLGKIFYLEQSPTSLLGAGRGGDAAPRMIQLKIQLQF